ncbi:MAG: S46 family peptidase [Bacteroidales bacterium]
MRRFLLGLIMPFFMVFSAKADEGMWLPFLVERLNYVDMQKAGLQLSPEEIYSINNSSLKDAIVIFGRGCTGEIISKEGLILTNHHCGYSSIQQVSSIQNNYLQNGFWANNKREEIPVEGLNVKFLVRVDPATDKVLQGVNNFMSEDERKEIISKNIKKIVKEAKEGNNYMVNVKEFFAGNEYYTFIYEVYNDIRLVGTPPECIGKFGADTDNWMWPRHTADFSMFRVYTDKDGKPAQYSKENIPMQSKHHLPINIAGVKEGDFAMIMGNPGSTERYLTSFGINMGINYKNPSIVKVRQKKLDIIGEDMDANKAVRLKYSSKYARIANYWKYFIGQTKSLKRLKVADKKKAIESKFGKWVLSDVNRKKEYGQVLADLEEAYEKLSNYEPTKWYYIEGALRGPEILSLANKLEKLSKAKNTADSPKKTKAIQARMKETVLKHFKNYNLATDQRLMSELFSMMYNDIDEKYRSPFIEEINKKYKGNFAKYSVTVFQKSCLANKQSALEFIRNPKSEKVISKDPAFIANKALITEFKNLREKTKVANDMLAHANRLFVKGIQEMEKDKKFYPDANFTMRLTYGQVKGYKPADAVTYKYYTTLKGVMQKEDPSVDEFKVPEKLKSLYKDKDYGRYGEEKVMKTCFLTNHDITGGNSGSPVINSKGELIGLAFDGNWEAMSGDIFFNNKVQRTINVDARYLLFLIDKFAGASNIIDELTIIDRRPTLNTEAITNTDSTLETKPESSSAE